MESFVDRIARLPHNRLALLATELYERSRTGGEVAEPIAITAMACRFPGESDTPEAFWSFLERGGDAIDLAPEDRLTAIGNPGGGAEQAPIWGGFLRQVDGFDPGVFGISAKEAEMMDPQQRLLLEVCWEALENTGTPINALDSETGVFIGVSGIDYALLGLNAGIEPNGYLLTGAAHSVIAGRLSYVFGFNGPSTVMDTACAAAASAIHLACQSLRANECEQAIAGGVNLLLIPELARTLGTMQVMASDGRCKAFSADADGFVRAEGCGVIVLRRLPDALVRGEPILGVIRGSAWNQDGKSGGLTAPNGAAQERVIRAALANAGLSPDRISYLEAHGTGTALGDPIELSALARVFDTGTRQRPLPVGSVKTNIGHLEAAAGMASVIKVLLAFRHEKIPRHLHATTLSPRLDWAALPLRVPTVEAEWPRGPEPRIAGVSAFGISGTNVHLVISEPPLQVEADPSRSRSSTLLTLSAKSPDALAALAGRYADVLAARPELDIASFTAAANVKRAHFAHRLALVVADRAEAERELRRFSEGDAGGRVRVAYVSQHRAPRIGMLFEDVLPDPGQFARLRDQEPGFRAAADAWRASAQDGPAGEALATGLASTSVLAGFQVALTELWRAWGIRPVLVAGEGRGEIAAAVAAGALSVPEAAELARRTDAGVEPSPCTTRQSRLPMIVGSPADIAEAGQPLPSVDVAAPRRMRADQSVRERAEAMVDRLIVIGPTDEIALLDELASAWLAGAPVNWTEFHAGERTDAAPLPNYPFQRKRFWPQEFRKKSNRQRAVPEPSDRTPDDGLYRVEWRPADQTIADDRAAAGRASRKVLLLHRVAASASVARSALEAAGLVVQDAPIATGPLASDRLASPAAGRDDAVWLYVVPNRVGAADPGGEARVALEDILVMAQAALELGAAAPAVYVVTSGAQPVNATSHPQDATGWGLGRVLVSEAPGVRACFVDLDASSPDWAGLANIIASPPETAELALADGRALAPALAPVQLRAGSTGPLASAEASYIVTGAFGFIGALTVRWLADQGAGKLFLVGHNPPRQQALEAIAAARAAGTEVETVVADVGVAADVEALFARVEADRRPLKGVIHSAAALDDAAISRQTPASLARALGAKATGAWLLHERSLHHVLDFFVLYSSAAALIGPPGQANYAAANCYLDALAHYRRGRGLAGLSLNWGLWTSTGLAIKRDVFQGAATNGTIPITPEWGMDVLGRAIASGETQLAVLPLDWAQLRQTLGARRPPTLLRVLLSSTAEAAGGTAAGGLLLASYMGIYEAAQGAERCAVLTDFTRKRSAELLGLDPTRISEHEPLLDLGLDSLVGLELRNDLQVLAGIIFPSTLFFDCPTLAELAQYFQLVLPAEKVPGASVTEPAYERISV